MSLLFISMLFIPSVHCVEIITHTSVSELLLTTPQLRRIYTMRQLRWADNSHITVYVLASQDPLHKAFSKERLHIFPYQLDRIWHKLTYSGLGTSPIVVDSPEALIQKVGSTPGAIGYIDEITLNKIKDDGDIHVVKIQD